MRKIYRVKINDKLYGYKTRMWYARYSGCEFDCYLKLHDKLDESGREVIVFAMDDLHIIHQSDCIVISEKERLAA